MVVITSNLPSEVEKIAQSLIILREGELQFSGNAAELVNQAQGKVWEVLLPENGPNSIVEPHNLSRLRQLNDGTMLRIVGKAPDWPGIQPVEPTLGRCIYALDVEGKMLIRFRSEFFVKGAG